MRRESELYYDALYILRYYRETDDEKTTASLQSVLEIMRNYHKHGEMYYWILYYCFLSPKPCPSDEAVLSNLKAHGFGVTKNNFYGRRRAAIYAFAECYFAIK